VPLAVAVETQGPVKASPGWIDTVTLVRSLAVPWKTGAFSFVGERGGASVMLGARVSTPNAIGAVVVEFPAASVSVAATVYVFLPSLSGGLTGGEVQAPPVPLAVAVATATLLR